MKKATLIIGLLMLMLGVVWAAQTSTTTATGQYRNAKVQMITATFDNDWPYTNMDNLTLTTGHVQGIVTRIEYDSTGTDTDWDLELKDTAGTVIFTKDGLTSASEPGAYAIFEPSYDGNSWFGVPVSGYLSVDIDSVAQQDEVQTCTCPNDADAGTYTVTIDGETTDALAFDANTAFMVVALEALSNIGTSGMTSVANTLDDCNTNPIVLTFADALGNIPAVTFADVNDSNSGPVSVVETTEGGNLFSELLIYIYYEQ